MMKKFSRIAAAVSVLWLTVAASNSVVAAEDLKSDSI